MVKVRYCGKRYTVREVFSKCKGTLVKLDGIKQLVPEKDVVYEKKKPLYIAIGQTTPKVGEEYECFKIEHLPGCHAYFEPIKTSAIQSIRLEGKGMVHRIETKECTYLISISDDFYI